MIKLENTEVFGWEAAIRGMRNPKNSWEKSDSVFSEDGEYHDICGSFGPATLYETHTFIGDNDHDLMMRLAKGGPVHAKYRRMITVYVDITAPLYWWKEFDTYKVGTVANSCSTMHKIHDKEFTIDDFSCEHLIDAEGYKGESMDESDIPFIDVSLYNDEEHLLSPFGLYNMYLIKMLNLCREKYLETKDKRYWWQLIQLLPSSYNQRRTVMLNYEVLHNIYTWRKDHKLDEWHTFCHWIEALAYSEIITGE